MNVLSTPNATEFNSDKRNRNKSYLTRFTAAHDEQEIRLNCQRKIDILFLMASSILVYHYNPHQLDNGKNKNNHVLLDDKIHFWQI